MKNVAPSNKERKAYTPLETEEAGIFAVEQFADEELADDDDEEYGEVRLPNEQSSRTGRSWLFFGLTVVVCAIALLIFSPGDASGDAPVKAPPDASQHAHPHAHQKPPPTPHPSLPPTPPPTLALPQTPPPTLPPTQPPTLALPQTPPPTVPPKYTPLVPSNLPNDDQYDDDATVYDDDATVYFTHIRTDRSGSQVLDFFMADAHIHTLDNAAYGGACFDQTVIDDAKASIVSRGKHHWDEQQFIEQQDDRLVQKQELLDLVGFSHLFPFACPEPVDVAAGKALFINEGSYRHDHTSFVQEWLDYLRAQSTFQYEKRGKHAPLKVAVHVRRGDYHPCGSGGRKYLPNSYYLDAIDAYLPAYCTDRECDVTVYSEEKSFEEFDPFLERGYTIDFDSSLEEIWTAFINADVLFISRSSFSFTPAFLNLNHVITPVYHYGILPGWQLVNETIWENTENEIARLVAEQCDERKRW